MTARHLLPLLALLAACLFAPRVQATQLRCALAETPVLDFGQPVANPTAQSDSTATVRVTCLGDDTAAGQVIEVCVLAAPGANSMMRRGASHLRYGLFADSAHTRPLVHPAGAAAASVRFGERPNVTAQADIRVYGVIPPGQSGLAGGLHDDRVPLQVRVATEAGQDCTTAPTRATGFLDVRAQLALGSCTVNTVDLDFGRAVALGRAIDGGTVIGLTCTAGTPYSVALNGGNAQQVQQRRMAAPAGGAIAYQLYRDGARTQVWGDTLADRVTGTGTGTPQTLPVYARVPAQPTPRAGGYSDVITATVTY